MIEADESGALKSSAKARLMNNESTNYLNVAENVSSHGVKRVTSKTFNFEALIFEPIF